MNLGRRPRGDAGVSLVMALVFMLVVSMFVTVALTKSQATTSSGMALRDRGQIQYALDGGVERGLEAVRDASRSTAETLCKTAGSTSEIPGSPMPINAHDVTVTCENLGGSGISDTSLTSNYAIVLLSEEGDALRTSGAVAAVPEKPCDDPAPPGGYLRLKASLYLAGPQSNSAVNPPLVLCDGHAVQFSGAPCTEAAIASLTNLQVVTPTYVRSCTDQSPSQATPTFTGLPARPVPDPDVSGCYVDVTAAGLIRNSPCDLPATRGAGGGPISCRIYYPGRYQTAPALGSDTYFASGTYLFDDAGEVTVGASQQVVAGRRVMDSDQGLLLDSTSCNDVDDTDAADAAPTVEGVDLGTRIDASGGAQWVFDGDSQLSVSGDLTVHARPYTSPNPPFTFIAGGYSSWVQGTGSTTGGGASCSTGFALCNSSAGSRMVINGRIYAPTAPAQIFATNGTENVITGGAVLHSLKVGASVSGGGAMAVSGPGGGSFTPPPFRTVRITATTTGTSEMTRAVATVSNFGPAYTVSVKSWRTGTP